MRGLLAEMGRDVLFRKRTMRLALLKHLIEAKLSGETRFGKNLVMECYLKASKDDGFGHRDDKSWQAGLEIGLAGKESSAPAGMDVLAFNAGVTEGRAVRAAGGKWEVHAGRALLPKLRRTLGEYFAEDRLSGLPREKQPAITIKLPGYEPLFERRMRGAATKAASVGDTTQSVAVTVIDGKPSEHVVQPVQKQRLSGQFLADVFGAATEPEVKSEFLFGLPHIRCPELVDASLLVKVTEAAASEGEVGRAARYALGWIIARQPNFADGAMINKILKIAAAGEKHGEAREEAEKILTAIFKRRPDLLDLASVAGVAKNAIWRGPQSAAQKTLEVILEQNRSEFVETILSIWRIADADEVPSVRWSAQETLGILLKKTPGLVDTVLASVLKAAADADRHVRAVALKTLMAIIEKRPDLAETMLASSSVVEIDMKDRVYGPYLLQIIVNRRPELADRALAIIKTAHDHGPDIWPAICETLPVILKHRPDLADTELIASVTRIGSTYVWLRTLSIILEKRPDLAETGLIQSVIDIASADAATDEKNWDVRRAAHGVLQVIFDRRPNLIEATFAAAIFQSAKLDVQEDVRRVAYRTLQVILEQRPDLADAALTAAVAQTAETESERGRSAGMKRSAAPRTWAAAIELMGLKTAADGSLTTCLGSVAEQTLQVIAEHRPDLVQSDPNRKLARLIYLLGVVPYLKTFFTEPDDEDAEELDSL